MVNWILRKFNEGDIEHFLDWRKVYAKRIFTQELWNWQYLRGPWGPMETWLAEDNGKIVGQSSSQRYEAFYFGKKIMASLNLDVATHPDYRKQGIFVTLGAHHFKEEGKQNILFSTALPRERGGIWPTGMKFNWHGLCPIPLLVNNCISDLNLEKTSKYQIKSIKKFGKEFEGFSENFKDSIPIYLNRTVRYLNWRFVEKPNLIDPKHHYNYLKYQIIDKTGEMVAYIVLKYYQSENESILHLIDFLLPNEEEIYNIVLNFLIEKANIQGIKTVSMLINRSNPFGVYLNKYGFNYANKKGFYIVRRNTDFLDEIDLFKEENHYITMADSDIY